MVEEDHPAMIVHTRNSICSSAQAARPFLGGEGLMDYLLDQEAFRIWKGRLESTGAEDALYELGLLRMSHINHRSSTTLCDRMHVLNLVFFYFSLG